MKGFVFDAIKGTLRPHPEGWLVKWSDVQELLADAGWEQLQVVHLPIPLEIHKPHEAESIDAVHLRGERNAEVPRRRA